MTINTTYPTVLHEVKDLEKYVMEDNQNKYVFWSINKVVMTKNVIIAFVCKLVLRCLYLLAS